MLAAMAPDQRLLAVRDRHDVVRGHEFHHASIIDKGSDEPFVEVMDAQGKPVVETGSRRGLVSGTFFHAIARET